MHSGARRHATTAVALASTCELIPRAKSQTMAKWWLVRSPASWDGVQTCTSTRTSQTSSRLAASDSRRLAENPALHLT
ncbi:hypothetical protein M431DRAFT_415422 [Trichoderma harzianum CBS 226.95]|uniref:Uncharacterized protein n=1 Tax=Trichoderma harzianum CBS 226.95 TaxID=983964 RepID=A0A2T4AG08_TRIHA|nr:hypothetical protein M431DRAFT_415422 [Trichoderma harzianum CBS 226.95]PTB56007.1 hypothetical protein M431DRAFT_415422 [Trichoderma harzianum CBS 226.95]